MSEYNIQMNKYNALNVEYDQLYPATKIENVDGLNTALQKKANSSDVYTKGEVDTLFQTNIQTAVLNVTTNAEAVVTATKGSKALSATADSSGLAVLYPNEFGTWTLKVTSNGKTLEVPFVIDAIAVFNTTLLPLEDASWELISNISESGKASSIWSVGDKKTINVGGTYYQFRIIGFNHDDKTNGGKAGITFEMVDVINSTTYPMNSSNTNSVGWEGCTMRNSTLSNLFNNLPSDLQTVIKTVNKLTSAGNQSSTIKTTSDKLFLLSEIEIFGSIYNSYSGEGSQYDYYKAGNSKVKKASGSPCRWWVRSPCNVAVKYYCDIDSAGLNGYNDATSKDYISFAFCV